MISAVPGSDESWVGNYWGDLISTSGGEDGSPTITSEMVAEAASDPFNRYTLFRSRAIQYQKYNFHQHHHRKLRFH